MSANDILDVLNVQRDDTQPAKKRQKVEPPSLQKGGMARELYNLLGPNTPPVSVNMGGKNKDRRQKVSPWTRMPFVPNRKRGLLATFKHWEKGSRELLEASNNDKDYFFDKFLVDMDVPELVDEAMYDNIMAEIRELERAKRQAREKQHVEKSGPESSNNVPKRGENGEENVKARSTSKAAVSDVKNEGSRVTNVANGGKPDDAATSKTSLESISKNDGKPDSNGDDKTQAKPDDAKPADADEEAEKTGELSESQVAAAESPESKTALHLSEADDTQATHADADYESDWTYEETQILFQYCKDFELKWHIINDRFPACFERSMEDLKEHFYRKKMLQKANVPADPVPPPIPLAASSSHKRDRTFQTHLQQYLAGVLKNQAPVKGEPNAIQQLLAKRLTTKEEEAYGLHYHANERLNPNVILRSTQKLSGLQQRQSVFKAVNNVLQELGIPTAGGTSWKPNMPTRKTMAKYDEMVKAVVALLEVKKGKDKLEAEIELIKSQRGLL
ncbi:hypothetical protein HF325_005988 [Metschnikowia pulcherrima]|uniref:SWR1-complex protein 4 n=1 Tax=Metschnikowia pulcherrima TaxID=27326 RepID=A0A8H7GLR4_9ASCO|nr:hypothetical protein HF325_005988 [Metschnikowia pulcherrima]